MKTYIDLRDWWVGLYWSDDGYLYVCPLPTWVIRFDLAEIGRCRCGLPLDEHAGLCPECDQPDMRVMVEVAHYIDQTPPKDWHETQLREWVMSAFHWDGVHFDPHLRDRLLNCAGRSIKAIEELDRATAESDHLAR